MVVSNKNLQLHLMTVNIICLFGILQVHLTSHKVLLLKFHHFMLEMKDAVKNLHVQISRSNSHTLILHYMDNIVWLTPDKAQ